MQYTCRCSYLQIYQEAVLDLLKPDTGKQHTLSHNNQGIHVEGLHEQVVLNGVCALISVFLHHVSLHRPKCRNARSPHMQPIKVPNLRTCD
jgi:hypothetical protein